MVLSTLQQLIGDADYYPYNHLFPIIKSFSPNMLAVELTPADLKARKLQRVKQEYQYSIYPLIDRHVSALYDVLLNRWNSLVDVTFFR